MIGWMGWDLIVLIGLKSRPSFWGPPAVCDQGFRKVQSNLDSPLSVRATPALAGGAREALPQDMKVGSRRLAFSPEGFDELTEGGVRCPARALQSTLMRVSPWRFTISPILFNLV